MKKIEHDDDRTIADMNIAGMPWYNALKKRTSQSTAEEKINKKTDCITLTAKEKTAILKAALSVTIPLILFFGLGFFAIMLFMDFVWLR